MNKERIYNKLIEDSEPYKGDIYLVCCFGVEYDYDIVSHFIRYYKGLGINKFLFILNTENRNSEKLEYVKNIFKEHRIKEREIWIDYFHEFKKIDKMRDLVKKETNEFDWVIMADSDEFYNYFVDVRKLITYCDKNEYDFVVGEIVDRLSITGKPIDISDEINLWETFPVKRYLTKNVSEAPDKKVVLNKSCVELNMGHHAPLNKEGIKAYPYKIEIDHFKYRGNILENLKNRELILKKHGHGWCHFSENLLDYYNKKGTFL